MWCGVVVMSWCCCATVYGDVALMLYFVLCNCAVVVSQSTRKSDSDLFDQGKDHYLFMPFVCVLGTVDYA